MKQQECGNPTMQIFKTAKEMTPIDVDRIVAAVAENFRCFGRGASPMPGNPIGEALKNRPLVFAAGVDVKDVVEFIIRAAKC